jgi:hypothetical protein
MIGKIQRIPLRGVWKHEAHDFTRWLQENLDVLDDVLDFTLASAVREQAAGDFSVDLVAKDELGETVVIENQFGRSDHDHLGKLLTYTSKLEAKKAVWIVGDPRPEHVQAITSLNETKATAYYLVKLEGIRIADSLPAPLFTLIVGPSEEGREVGELKKELAATEIKRRQFWTQLLSEANKITTLHAHISPGVNHWISTSERGLSFNYVILKHDASVEMYIDRGKRSDSENKIIFDKLYKQKRAIERAFGGRLEWQRLNQKRASRIKKSLPGGGLADESKWPSIQQTLIETMIRFAKAIKPHI